jgi:hypothetical protein
VVIAFVRERRLDRVTDKCLEAKTKTEREHRLEVLRTLQGTGENPQLTRQLPRPRRSRSKAARTTELASAAGSTSETP